MIARPRSDARNAARYLCRNDPGTPGCGRVMIVLAPTDDHVRDLVLTALDNPGMAQRLRQRGAPEPDLHSMIRSHEDDLQVLAADFGARQISHNEWRAAREPITARLNAARQRLATSTKTTALDGFVGTAEEMTRRWELANLSQRRAIITAVMERVIVRPATPPRNRFDSDRLEPVWRV
jgi:hypothetical protein